MLAADLIQTRCIDKAESIAPDSEVRPYPGGGFCIAERLAGSTAYIYHATHPSEHYLKAQLAKSRAAAIEAVMKGRIPGVDQAALRDLGQIWMDI